MKLLKNKKTIATLKHLAAKNGGVLMPEAVVDAAKPEESPLHSYFTWDDGEAAEKWRIHQARNLINVCVEHIGGVDNGKVTRVFVSLKDDREEGGYRTLVNVLKNETLREYLVSDALEEMTSFREKYKTLRELADVFSAMSAAEKRLRR